MKPSPTITSVRALAAAVADANAAQTPLRIVGAGHWLGAGRPVDESQALDVSQLKGVVEYTPGDLTLTALAGTSLEELDAVTQPHGQWLTLDPAGPRSGTLGATLATASSGPLAASFGTPRDVALGVTFVNGEGEVIQGGGRVVKNVAGFDLVRLSIGAWGTLGILAEVTVRIRAIPTVDLTVQASVPTGRTALADRLRAYREAAAAPLAVQLLNGPLARAVGLAGAPTVLIRLAGNPASVAAQRDILHRLAPLDDAPGDVWRRLTESDPRDAYAFRTSIRPSELSEVWSAVQEALGTDGAALSAQVTRGSMRVVVPLGAEDSLDTAIMTARAGGNVVPERLPARLWPTLPWPTNALMERVRQAFDPNCILNRGMLGSVGTATS
ncbi:MAG: FAD-binding oxidoreductase [Gemmatimonadaceae bacterium]